MKKRAFRARFLFYRFPSPACMTTIFGACPDHSGSGVFGNINKRVAGEHEDPDQSDLRSFCFFFFQTAGIDTWNPARLSGKFMHAAILFLGTGQLQSTFVLARALRD